MSVTYKPEGEIRGIIFAGVGHGGNDPGAVKYGREEDMNLIQALAAKDYWVSQGFMVVMSRNKDENDPLSEEIREANAIANLLCAVDFHNNAGGGDGFEVIHGINSSMNGSMGLAKAIEKEVIAIGQNSRGCKTRKNSAGQDYFGFIRQVKVHSVICEGCFVDNKTDMKLFDTKAELQAYGVAVAKGTINWLEDTGKVKPVKKATTTKKPAVKKPVKKPAEKKPATTKKSVRAIALEVMEGKHGNGEARKKSLAKAYPDVPFDDIQDMVNEMTALKKKETSKAFYTVKKGDTLSQIAKNKGTTYLALAKLNGLKPPYTIYIGQKIRVK